MLIFLVLRVIGTGRISLTLPDGTFAIQTFRQDTGEEVGKSQTAKGSFSKTLPSGDYEVRVFSGDKKASSYFVNVPRFFGEKKVAAELNNQGSRTKLGRGTNSCPVLGTDGLYSYNCFGSTFPQKQVALTSSSYPLTQDIPGLSGRRLAASEYRDGLLVLYHEVNADNPESDLYILAFVKNGQVASRNALPKNFTSQLKGSGALLRVDRPTNERFVVYTKNNAGMLIYSNLESEPRLFAPSIPSKPEGATNTSLDFSGGTIALFFGTNPGSDTPTIEKEQTLITTYSVSDTEQSEKQSITIPSSFETASLCANESVCIYKRDGTLTLYSIADEKKTTTLYGVQDYFELPEKGTVYSQNGRIYLLSADPESSRMIYMSDNFTLSNISPSKDGILLNAFLGKGSQTSGSIHTFLLDPDSADTNTFPDDTLPYQKGKVSQIQDMDYSGSTILITLLLQSSTLSKATGVISYDQAEFDSVTSQVLSRLTSEGFRAPDYSVNFIVSY